MSYGEQLANLWNRQSFWANSTPAFYAAAAQDIFAITGGLVLIQQMYLKRWNNELGETV